MRCCLIVIFLHAAFGAIDYDEKRTEIQLNTPRGSLLGWHIDFGNDHSKFFFGNADVFLGIPYAQPPVGSKRFKQAEALCQYTQDGSPLRAQEYREACWQRGVCANNVSYSEDCLHVNVFSPNVSSTSKYPVMLYIHGGGLMRGCAQEYHYRGAIANLVSRGVVVVTMQYRLSALGYFTTSDDFIQPNIGALDQVEAIRWVADQISYFGGDPNKITLWGQSAGAASVSAHTYSPLSQDLFQQAITESGAVLTAFEGSLGDDHISERRAAELCGIAPEQWAAKNWTGLMECLMSKTPLELVELDKVNIIGWKMQVDKSFFPDIPHRLAPMRKNIPHLMGTNHDEWSYYDMQLALLGGQPEFYNQLLFELEFDVLAGFIGERQDDMRKVLQNVFAGFEPDPTDELLWMKMISNSFTGGAFTSFTIRDFEEYRRSNNTRVYLYEMTYGPQLGKLADLIWKNPVFHTAEVNYIWKRETEWSEAIDKGVVSSVDYDLAEWFGETWTNFAKYGDPMVLAWKPLPLTGTTEYLNIDSPRPRAATDYKATDNLVWNKVMPALVGDYFPPQRTNSTVSIPQFEQIKRSSQASSCPAI